MQRPFMSNEGIARFVRDINQLIAVQEAKEAKRLASKFDFSASERPFIDGVLDIDPHKTVLSRGQFNSMSYIVDEVCRFYGVRRHDLMSQRRGRRLAWPRHIAMYLCITKTKFSYPRVGNFFDRDHTTVMHAVKVVETQLQKLRCNSESE